MNDFKNKKKSYKNRKTNINNPTLKQKRVRAYNYDNISHIKNSDTQDLSKNRFEKRSNFP